MSKKRKKHKRKKMNKGAIIAIAVLIAILLSVGIIFSIKRVRTTRENNKNANMFIQLEEGSNPVFILDNGLYTSQSIQDGEVPGKILNTHEEVVKKHAKSSWGERAFFSFMINDFSKDSLLVLEFSAVSDRTTPALVEINCGSFSTAVEVDSSKNMYYIPLNGSGVSGEISFVFDITGDATPITFGNFCVAEYTDDSNVSQVKSGQYLAEEFEAKELSSGLEEVQSAYLEGNGKYLYSVMGGNLTVYDSTGSVPVQIGILEGIGNAENIFFSEEKNVLLITSGGSGVYFVDVSNPEKPRLSALYEPLEIAGKAVMYGNYAFICEEQIGIEVVDCSDMSEPRYVTHVSEEKYGDYKECRVENGYLYAITYEEAKTDIYDVRDLSNICLICTLPLDANGMSLDVEGNYLYAVTASSSSRIRSKEKGNGEEKKYSVGSGNGFEVYDISNPAEPVLLCRKRIDGRLTDFSQNSFEARVAGDYGFFSFGKAGVYVYDISDPSRPKRVKYYYASREESGESLVSGEDFMPYPFEKESRDSLVHSAIGGSGLYCMTSSNGLFLADTGFDGNRKNIGNQAVLSGKPVISKILTSENYNCEILSVEGDVFAIQELTDGKLALASGTDGLIICNRNLEKITSIKSGYPVKDIRVSGDVIYAAEGTGGFATYRYSDGTLDNLGRKAESKYTAYYDSLEVAEGGKTVLAQAGNGRLKMIDCSDPAKPKMIAVSTEEPVRRMKHRSICIGLAKQKYLGASGPKLMKWFYSTNGEDGFQVEEVNVETKHNLSDYCGFAVARDNCIVTTNKGYIIFDPETDQELYNVNLGEGWTGGKCITDGDLLIVSNAYNGEISILDITNPDTPVFLLQLETDYVTDVPCVIGGDIYVPLRHDGVLKISKK